MNKLGVIYLVCTLWNYSDIKQLALHRFKSATLLNDKSAWPNQFKLTAYVQNDYQFAYPISAKAVQLKVLFKAEIAEHLYETPLTADQILSVQDDKRILLESTIIDTLELRWWLSGFGSSVEVLEPIILREYFQHETDSMVAIYKN